MIALAFPILGTRRLVRSPGPRVRRQLLRAVCMVALLTRIVARSQACATSLTMALSSLALPVLSHGRSLCRGASLPSAALRSRSTFGRA